MAPAPLGVHHRGLGRLALATLVLWFAWDLPRPSSALDAVRRPGLTLEDRTGRIFAAYGDVVGQPMHLSELPPYVPEAARRGGGPPLLAFPRD